MIVVSVLIPMKIFSGDNSEGETPDTIPNSEVKPFSADDTVLFRDGKVGHRREKILNLSDLL